MTDQPKPQGPPRTTHTITFTVSAHDMRPISQAAKRTKTTVSQYAKQELFLRVEKDLANG